MAAYQIGSLLQQRRMSQAVIDLDEIRRHWPAPPEDPSDFELELRNLRPLAANYPAAGARRLVLAGVCESREERERYAAVIALPLVVCRLRALLAVLQDRLRRRHADDPGALAWYLARAHELDLILDAADIADLDVSAERRTVREVAAEVAAAIGWATG